MIAVVVVANALHAQFFEVAGVPLFFVEVQIAVLCLLMMKNVMESFHYVLCLFQNVQSGLGLLEEL